MSSPIEDELRAVFRRHEVEVPAAGPVRARIDVAWVRARRRRLVRRAAGAAAAVLMAGAAVPVAVESWQHEAPLTDLTTGVLTTPAEPGPVNVLLIGGDNRQRNPNPGDRRADTVMIIHVPADRSRAYLVSLPRDGEVELPGGVRGKLNETLRIGGPELTEKIVTGLTGVEFDATVTIDFRALRAVTKAVGGVEVCLPQSFTSVHNGRRYPRGCQRLGADDVTPVLQARYGLENGSYDRDRNGQRFLRALFAKLTTDGTFRSPIRMNELLMAGRDGIEIDGEPATLLRAIPRGSTEVVGVSEPGFQSIGNGRERIYPRVGPELYAAIQDDDLAAWTGANPTYLLR
ncbi:LCP family protein [Amorphoplanes digitatis]|uniref:LCP family protein required for cell wall assembly n=1 Tax=Actinoplanes digitatis TaxID=1868 RepID=A0A7W7MU70_9ACTN|nr:LCP family protein [Actinoplanes digitatis]MBB4767151.1 LCP family protein required for cell wall assembly [Actinoplanes digitatis]GID95169.1 hypothetical protein Adi01nite_45810 [Actinoplanes digitatis]